MRGAAEGKARPQERPYFWMSLSERNPGPGNLGKELGRSEPDLGRGWVSQSGGSQVGEEETPEAPDGSV